MTLVIETSENIKPASNDAISKILKACSATINGDALTFGEHNFHYYTISDNEDADKVIADLINLPGVNAAYIKPAGMPPSM